MEKRHNEREKEEERVLLFSQKPSSWFINMMWHWNHRTNKWNVRHVVIGWVVKWVKCSRDKNKLLISLCHLTNNPGLSLQPLQPSVSHKFSWFQLEIKILDFSQTKWGPSSLVNGVSSLKKDISKLHLGVEQNSWEFENLLFTFENEMGKYKFSILKLGIWDWGLGAEAHILSHWGALIDLDGMELNFGADLSRIARNCIPNQSFSNHLFQSNTFVQSQEVHPGNIRLKFQIFRLYLSFWFLETLCIVRRGAFIPLFRKCASELFWVWDKKVNEVSSALMVSLASWIS